MSSELIKLLAPIGFVAVWCLLALRTERYHLAGAALFFTSIVSFSQNFRLVYRESHQMIQVLLIALAVFSTIFSWRVLRINAIFAGLLLFIGVSLFFAPIDADAKAQLVNFICVIGMVNFLYLACSTQRDLDWLMNFVGLLSVLLAAVGIFEHFAAGSLRAEATMSNPNYYGYFLGMGYCIISAQSSGYRRIIGLSVILIGIFVSGSRSSFLFPLLQFIWNVYQAGNVRKMLLYCAVCALAVAALLASNLTRFSDAEASQGSDAERVIFALIGLRMANDHPFTGVGWGRYASEFSNYANTAEAIITDVGTIDVSGQDRRVTHNDLIRILAELGWVAFIAAVAVCLLAMAKIIRWKGFGYDYLFGIWTGSVGFSLTHNNMNSGLFWFFFLMPFFLHRQGIKGPDAGATIDRELCRQKPIVSRT